MNSEFPFVSLGRGGSINRTFINKINLKAHKNSEREKSMKQQLCAHQSNMFGVALLLMGVVFVAVVHASSGDATLPITMDAIDLSDIDAYTEVVTVQNCSCTGAGCPPPHTVVSGVCYQDPLNPLHGRVINCMDQQQQCAQLINFNDPQCTQFSGVYTAVCGACQQLFTGYYAKAKCDPLTQQVEWDTNCNAGCSICMSHNSPIHPFLQCSPGLGGNNGYTYNQGITMCDAANVTVYNSPTCAGAATVLDAFVVGQYSCSLEQYMSCSPKPPITPVQGQTVSLSFCGWNTSAINMGCINCNQTLMSTNKCMPAPQFLQNMGIKSHTARCNAQPGVCADLVIHNNSACSQLLGRSTPVCNSCVQLFNSTTYNKVTCNQSTNDVIIQTGCGPTCTQCTGQTYVHQFGQCDPGVVAPTTVLNRGLFPCSVVQYNHYSTTNCGFASLVHIELRAEGICEMDRMSVCETEQLVTVQNCSNPSATTVAMENTCVEDAFGKYRSYTCYNHAKSCASLVHYSDNRCQKFAGGSSAVCGTCMKVFDPISATEVYQRVDCNATSGEVFFTTACNANCTMCHGTSLEHPVGICTPGLNGDFIVNEGLSGCDAVQIAVYNNNNCTNMLGNFTVQQDMCAFDEFIQCTYDPLPPAPTGNEIQLVMCDGPCMSSSCNATGIISGGCVENFQGRPGGHVVSCNRMESYCADLSVHSNGNCGAFEGLFHPVCGQCMPSWYNSSDPNDYTLVSCSPENPNVTLSLNCDSTCTNCQYPAAFSHPYLQCSPDSLRHGWSIINRGVIPCATASIIQYSDPQCYGGTQLGSWSVARDFCDLMGPDGSTQYVTCVPLTIGVQNCTACQTQGTSTACNKNMIQEGSCVPDPFAMPNILNPMRTISCTNTWQQCAHLAVFNGGTCSPSSYRTSLSVVCGQCNQIITYNSQGVRQINYAMVKCSAEFATVTMWMCTDGTCMSCKNPQPLIEQNTCNAMALLGSVYSYGLQICDAVSISQFNSASCTGAPYAQYTLGQHQCNFDEYYECSARPPIPPAPFNGKVTVKTCAQNDIACMSCTNQTYASGECFFMQGGSPKQQGWSSSVTCNFDLFVDTCVNFAIHNGSQCTGFLGDHFPVCGSCMQWMGEGTFTQITCDMDTQTVTVGRYCDSNCQLCLTQDVHPYGVCTLMNSTITAGLSVFNHGLMPCNTVTVKKYSAPQCNGNNLEASFRVGTSSCAFDTSYFCEPHKIYTSNCRNILEYGNVTMEGECTPDPFGMYRRYRCANTPQMCATLMQYNQSTTCATAPAQPFPEIISGVCGSCFLQTNWNTGAQEWMLMQCDSDLQSVSIFGNCRPNCFSCDTTPLVTHPFMTCSTGHLPGTSIFNQGLRPCTAIQVEVYQSNSCTGSPQMMYQSGQRDCAEFDHLYTYCDNNPRLVPPPAGMVLWTMCPWNQQQQGGTVPQEGDCSTGCQTFPVPSGACAPAPPGETRFVSHIVQCDSMFTNMCGDMVLFNVGGGVCGQQGSFVGVHTPVCGSCFLFGDESTYTQAVCNTQYETISFNTGCNADCSVCTTTGPVLDPQSCNAAEHPGLSVFFRGLFQCPTVTFKHFSVPNCDPNYYIGSIQVAQGMCEFNQHLQCTANVVTLQNCSNPSQPVQYTADQTCAADPYGHYRKYTCANTMQYCSNMILFSDQACNTYQDGFTVTCGTCWKQEMPNGQAVFSSIECNMTSQQVMIQTGCSDYSCNDCNGMVFTHPFNQCSQFMQGTSLFNTGIQPCDTVSVAVFTDSLCSTAPVATWTQSQNWCAMDGYVACQAAPIVTASASADAVLMYTCPANSIGCIGCSISTENSGSCYPIPNSANYRSTKCDTSMQFCVNFALHNDASCVAGFVGAHYPVCGSCARWWNQATFTHVQCDPLSQNVTMSFQCNAGCTQCGETVVHPFAQCSQLITNPSQYLVNHGVQPCATVNLTEYTSNTCAQNTAVASYLIAENQCMIGFKVECTTVAMPPATNAPTTGSSGLSAGGAAGVTIAVIVVVAAAAAAAYRYKQRSSYKKVPESHELREGVNREYSTLN